MNETNSAQDNSIEVLVSSIIEKLGCEEELTRDFITIALEDIRTFDEKQQDYGSRNISEFGVYGVLVRSNDKISRLKNLYKKQRESKDESTLPPKNETIEDSWRDQSVYGTIARMLERGMWDGS